ncbi:hypothetical protein MBM_03332 [Drepanopeziza brunnea f. sp. 'multigermtubi' MB_m1]|uniref:Alpha-1,3-mannosyltransferase n=1 Tax=Marssonina brunnea f. sp. multigermtubi (strain MB_m1) TaxID=1072389 RepID=K1XZR8_MARBU|nr:uncharacterized protein MBM_03332 [Drepanopeziza brunnea f. sp. 'multigermtubi' MB_m1]EKD18339.1 hypothetical protein MBM_03332 [Drepanopeziza brunnea f. sp. 'multigermtubi' MB_m1]
MPPHMHPRSRLTSSLFATTLFASFFVVALPHALPCPAPRVAYADDGNPQSGRRRRKRKFPIDEIRDDGASLKDGSATEESSDDAEDAGAKRGKRECPVPKPGGLVGAILGFGSSSSDEKRTKPP